MSVREGESKRDIESETESVYAVSYTHLDVYKRQVDGGSPGQLLLDERL